MQLLKLNQPNSALLQHLLYKHLAPCLSMDGANHLWFALPASIPPMSKLNPKFFMFFSLPANNRIQLVRSLLNIISRYFLVFGLINIITFFFSFWFAKYYCSFLPLDQFTCSDACQHPFIVGRFD